MKYSKKVQNQNFCRSRLINIPHFEMSFPELNLSITWSFYTYSFVRCSGVIFSAASFKQVDLPVGRYADLPVYIKAR